MWPPLALFLCLSARVFLMADAGLTAGRPSAAPEKPIWARDAIALDLSCAPHSRSITSPDRRLSAEVICRNSKGEDPTYLLRVITSDRRPYELPLDEGAHELLWAPNSSSFLVNGGDSTYSGFFVSVYQIEPRTGLRRQTITGAAQSDMVRSFPPCKAWNRDDTVCKSIARDPHYNMSGLAWRKDSSAIYVFAEVPCDTSYGGIMCQVAGYELSVPGGSILRRLSAPEVKQWSGYAAWDIRIPPPPRYGRALVTW